ncbi:MAG: maleylpyruvate isomerase N-terminal domain-containing protein [Jatrophihabitans sp.]
MALDARANLDLVDAATGRLLDTLAGLTDQQARAASGLPGWSRGHLLSHLARNADGMRNLLHWARTGEVRPMYREPDGRDADIESGSSRPAGELAADVGEAAGRWAVAAGELSEENWRTEIRRRPGNPPEPAWNLIDGRLFEVEFHHVDLDLGYRFADSPAELVDRALASTHGRLVPEQPFVAVLDGGRRLDFTGDRRSELEVHGSAAAMLGWLTGRATGSDLRVSGGVLPTLPAW